MPFVNENGISVVLDQPLAWIMIVIAHEQEEMSAPAIMRCKNAAKRQRIWLKMHVLCHCSQNRSALFICS